MLLVPLLIIQEIHIPFYSVISMLARALVAIDSRLDSQPLPNLGQLTLKEGCPEP
jgi:hypothetical protein